MQLQAIDDDGKLELCRPVRFAHGRLPVRVEVPEAELIESTTAEGEEPLGAYVRGWLHRLETIRAEAMTTRRTELQQISDEQLERLHAIKMRVES